MGLIPAETIEAIRARVDLAELVGERVEGLQRAGRNLKGRCPFHQERTPSFIVSPERQTFHCFGCGEGGDAFTFVMKLDNLGFMEAAEKLAERVGIKVETSDKDQGPEARERLKLRELLSAAAQFYHELLLKAPEAEAARKYFAGRKVTQESVSAFKLGYAPRTSSLIEVLQKQGYTTEQLVKAGLAANREGRLRDYFFDRVLFPIRDAKGAFIGFGGRTMGGGEPKYLNSPESPVFSKGRVLYGLNLGMASVRKARKAVLMEGYMDVIAAHQHGLPQACAALGTALTPDHCALLKRYAADVAIVFDADSAGLNAAVRGAEVALATGLGVRIATVPSGKDPDEFLHAKGLDAFKKECLMRSKDIAEFKTELLLSKEGQPLTPQAKSRVGKAVLETIERCPDEIVKAEWTKRLAERLDIPVSALNKQMDKDGAALAKRIERQTPSLLPPRFEKAELDAADRQILCLLIEEPGLTEKTGENDFLSQTGRAVFQALSAAKPWGDGWTSRVMDSLSGPQRSAASELFVEVENLKSMDPGAVLERVLHQRRGASRLKELEALMHEGRLEGDGMKEYQTLLAQLKGTKR